MSSHKVKMEVEGTPSDMMSILPPNIIQTVLTLMPLRDAFRTCILSHKWRDQCRYIPKLTFDDAVFEGSTYTSLSIKWELLYVVYPILLLHKGPILEFSLCNSKLASCCEIDQIILHLSRAATLKKFTLWVRVGDAHKLRTPFFNLQHLTAVDLQNCVFQPPSTFKGFDKLVCLSFNNVSVTLKVLLGFISGCPLLKNFTLIGDEKHLMGCWNSDFVELFECLPLVEHLCMSSYPIKMQHNPAEAVPATVMNLVDQRDCSDVILNNLCVLQITNFTNMKPGMDFVKLILGKSVMLKKVDIVIDRRVDVYGEVKMLKELVHFPRASTRAQIRFERP